MLQISKYAKLKYLDKVLFSYRWHSANTIKQTDKIENIVKQTIVHEIKILENIAIKLGIDVSKISTETLTNYGNQCGASIPCCISNIFAQKVSNNNVKCLLSGFGAGLSWANVIINLDNIYCSLLNEYDK